MAADPSQERLAFLVEALDGRRFKMVIKGDLHKLQVEKIRRYLKGNGVPDGLDLTFNGRVLRDDMVGEDFGLVPNSVLKLVQPMGAGGAATASSSSFAGAANASGSGQSPGGTPGWSSRYRSSSQQSQQGQGQGGGRSGAGAATRLGEYSPSTKGANSLGASAPLASQQFQRAPSNTSEVEGRFRQLQEAHSDFTSQGGQQQQQYSAAPTAMGRENPATYYDPMAQERALRMQRMTGGLMGGAAGAGASSIAPSEAPSGIHYSSANVSLTSHQYPQSIGNSPAKKGGPSSTLGGANAAAAEGPRVAALEAENDRLRREIESLRLDLGRRRQESPPSDDMLTNAKANLLELAKDLGLHLAFDQNLTCVIGNDERNTILVTFDAATERLYLYSTVLTALPTHEATRLKLFEVLLDGAMLGRDMAGGGIGISLQNNIAMLCTSIGLRSASQYALRDVAPAFLEALQRWRAAAGDIVLAASHEGGSY